MKKHFIGATYEVNQANMQNLVLQLDEAIERIAELEANKAEDEGHIEKLERVMHSKDFEITRLNIALEANATIEAQAAEIEKLEKRRFELLDSANRWAVQCKEAEAERDRLKAEIEARSAIQEQTIEMLKEAQSKCDELMAELEAANKHVEIANSANEMNFEKYVAGIERLKSKCEIYEKALKEVRACLPEELARPRMFIQQAILTASKIGEGK